MKKLAAVLGLVVSIAGRTAAADGPVERVVSDDCYVDYWSDAPQLWCHIVVAAPDLSGAVQVAEGITPTVSPDGSKIALSGGPQRDDIVVVSLIDGTLSNLTNGPAVDISPAWSPDGSKIAFASDRTGASAVFVMNADGSGVTRLTHDVGPAGRPAWSPDGSRIAFDCHVVSDNPDICSIAADGTALVRLTDAPGWDFGASWSPDGTRIAFLTQSGAWNMVAATMNADGSSVSVLGGGISGSALAWSLDGTRLAIASPPGACEADGRLCYDTLRVFTASGADLGFLAGGSNPTWARITMAPNPIARFNHTCTALDCTFDASPSWDLGSTLTSFTWDFGDGTTASGMTASHTFAEPGTQSVTLGVVDDAGLTGTRTQPVEIAANLPPVASFTAACTALTCDFNASASSDAEGWITSFTWDFGDGATGDGVGPYRHVFATAGSFTVTLTLTDNLGATGTHSQVVRAGNSPPVAAFTATCSGFTCTFDATASSDPDGTVVGYSWDLGDGTTVSGATLTHAYRAGQYSATLTVTDDGGATGTKSQLVTAVNASPVASFAVSCTALTCRFDASASSDSDGTVDHYGWNFGDGTVAPGSIATHTYATAGHFTVQLTITDNGGASAQSVKDITVGNAPPVAALSAACAGLTCGFNATASSDSDGTIASYAWAFGDGTTGAGAAPTHAYPAAGSFTVTLTVTDNLGATGVKSLAVTAVNTPPVAAFTSSCAALTCGFNASASSDSDGAIASYAWAFGDGRTGAGKTPTHVYATAGSFTVTLTVTDNGGASGTRTASVTVTQSHVGDLDGSASTQGGTWKAVVTVTVHTSTHGPLTGAVVSGSWTGGATTSCTTDGTGRCAVSRSAIPGGTRTVTFTVTGVTHASATYKAAANHDPDGDSNGTAIVVSKH